MESLLISSENFETSSHPLMTGSSKLKLPEENHFLFKLVDRSRLSIYRKDAALAVTACQLIGHVIRGEI